MKHIFFKIIAVVFVVVLSSCKSKLPNVLIIGDSISIGYYPCIKKHLRFKANVNHIGVNATHTDYGLNNIDSWLEVNSSDIILFNWGLWDLVYRLPASGGYGTKDKVKGVQQRSIDEYENNLEKLVEKLIKTNAELFFVTTSYIPIDEPGMYTEDAIKYNEVAKMVMKRHNIEVIDIYNKSRQIHGVYGAGSNNVHYNKKGYDELGRFISAHLMDFLSRNLENNK